MRITLEGQDENVPFSMNEFGEFILKTDHGDMYFRVIEKEQSRKCSTGWNLPHLMFKVVGQQISKLTVKSKEELAAEEAIQKAKDVLLSAEQSVRAAEHVLKVIKENN